MTWGTPGANMAPPPFRKFRCMVIALSDEIITFQTVEARRVLSLWLGVLGLPLEPATKLQADDIFHAFPVATADRRDALQP